ncbi:Uncharacterized protein DAT39_002448, partial [Clarias magur]
ILKESCRIAVAIFLLHRIPGEGARAQPVSYISYVSLRPVLALQVHVTRA